MDVENIKRSLICPLFVEKITNFNVNLFKEIIDTNGDDDLSSRNVVFSSAAVTLALACLYAGSKNKTRRQIAAVLNPSGGGGGDDDHLDTNLKRLFKILMSKCRRLLSSSSVSSSSPGDFNNDENVVVTAFPSLLHANRLYVERNVKVEQKFAQILRQYYYSDLVSADMKENSTLVQSEINEWVDDETDGKVSRPLHALSSETRLLLVNCAAFKSDWSVSFDRCATVKAPFYLAASDEPSTLEFIRADGGGGHFRFAQDDTCSVLIVPYDSLRFSMAFILPEKRYGLAELENEMTGSNIHQLLRTAYKTHVQVQIPKFKIETCIDLIPCLKSLGVSDVFSDMADLSTMCDTGNLHISQAVHKAVIEVNEHGTETAVDGESIVPSYDVTYPKCHKFTADHPFLFAILEENTDALAFLGHFYGR